jgi:tripartite-type tricarboxylate transporter receptor subunit TctC
MTSPLLIRRRLCLSTLVGAGLLASQATVATVWAQADKTARILVGFPPGGGTDAIARLLAEHLRQELGQTVLVENRPGAGGQLAAQALKAAHPDGLTVMLSHDHAVSVIPLTVRQPGYDPVRDFVPVGGIGTFVNALALPGAAKSVSAKAFLEDVRRRGGASSVGVPAPASIPVFAVQALAKANRLDLVPVPYRGSAPMMTDLIGEQIPAAVASIPDFIEAHKAGRVRVVAVMGRQRDPLLPDVPTFQELGISGFEEPAFYGLFAPAGTPAAQLVSWSQALGRVLARADVRQRLVALGLNVDPMSPDRLQALERRYTQSWDRIIRESGFQPE